MGGLWPSSTPLREPWEPVVWRPLSTAGSPRPVQSWVVRSENLQWASAVGRPCRTLGRQRGPGWPWSMGYERATPGRGPGGFPGDGGPVCPELWPLAGVHSVLRLRLQAPGPAAPSLHPAPSGRHRTRPHRVPAPPVARPPQAGLLIFSSPGREWKGVVRGSGSHGGRWRAATRAAGFRGLLLTQAPGPAGGGERNEGHVCPSGRARRPASRVCACSLRGFQNRHGPPPPLLAARGLCGCGPWNPGGLLCSRAPQVFSSAWAFSDGLWGVAAAAVGRGVGAPDSVPLIPSEGCPGRGPAEGADRMGWVSRCSSGEGGVDGGGRVG